MQKLSLFPTEIFYEFCNLDLKKIEKECLEFRENNPTELKSGVDSYQGRPYKNEEIDQELIKCLLQTQRDDKPFKSISTYSWININPRGSYNRMHQHSPYDGVFFSSVFYVKTPKNSGRIRFYDPRSFICSSLDMNYYHNRNTMHWVDPKENTLIMFPSWLFHDVEPNNSDEERISISTNIHVKW